MLFRLTWRLFVLAQVAMNLRTAAGDSVLDKGDFLLVCKQEPIELGIVLDSSRSINQADYDVGIKFLQDFLQMFDIGAGRNDVRVSLITFGNKNYIWRQVNIKDAFGLTKYTTKAGLIEAIGKVPHRKGGYTNTGDGIEYMATNQLASQFTRSWADRVSIVITDGNSQEGAVTKAKAEEARAAGIEMIAVGVGRVKDQELLNIAGNPNNVFKVDNFSELQKIKKTLANKTCFKKKKPTTPAPKISCGESSPADIYFVFSPAELGVKSVSWTTSFISSVVRQEALQEGFRFGVVSGSCPDDEGFDLDDYSTAKSIQQRLSQYSVPRMSALIRRLSSSGYSQASGGRDEAQDVAVLVAHGGKATKKLNDEVKLLMNLGIKVFVVDPSGKGIKIGRAITITGKTYKDVAANFAQKLCPN